MAKDSATPFGIFTSLNLTVQSDITESDKPYYVLAEAVIQLLCKDYLRGKITKEYFTDCMLNGIGAIVYDREVLQYIIDKIDKRKVRGFIRHG